jgi:hypothetical protein
MLNNPDENEDVRDYALILRHTQMEDDYRHIRLVLAGFTERGTAAAGRYLAEHWRDLYSDHVKGHLTDGCLGDFLIMIEGPSRPESVGKWKEDRDFKAITPHTLYAAGIKCDWADRIDDKPKRLRE